MEAIKRWLDPTRKSPPPPPSPRPRPRISSPVSGTFAKPTTASDAGALATTGFVPRDRGREATLAWLGSRGPEAVARLARDRDGAARQVRRGPRTLGNREVQEMLRAPGRRAAERFRLARRQAEVAVRYGVSGAAAYNFSRSLRWNGAEAAPRLLLALRPSGYGGGGGVTVAPAGPFTPIDWLELEPPELEPEPAPEPPSEVVEDCGCVSPISEPGGWRDTSAGEDERPESRAGFERDEDVEDVDVESPGSPRTNTDIETELAAQGDLSQDEWGVGEAQVVVIAGIPVWGVRQIYIRPHSRRPVGWLEPIEEVSSPEEK